MHLKKNLKIGKTQYIRQNLIKNIFFICDYNFFLNKIIIIVKVFPTARSSKLSQIESYVRTLSRRELELQ